MLEAAAVFDGQGVPSLVRRLCYAYCAEILGAIGEGIRTADTEPVHVPGEWMRDLYRLHSSMGMRIVRGRDKVPTDGRVEVSALELM